MRVVSLTVLLNRDSNSSLPSNCNAPDFFPKSFDMNDRCGLELDSDGPGRLQLVIFCHDNGDFHVLGFRTMITQETELLPSSACLGGS
jgi:hypothetical protein